MRKCLSTLNSPLDYDDIMRHIHFCCIDSIHNLSIHNHWEWFLGRDDAGAHGLAHHLLVFHYNDHVRWQLCKTQGTSSQITAQNRLWVGKCTLQKIWITFLSILKHAFYRLLSFWNFFLRIFPPWKGKEVAVICHRIINRSNNKYIDAAVIRLISWNMITTTRKVTCNFY